MTTEPRKRRRWPWIVGVLLLLFVVIGALGAEDDGDNVEAVGTTMGTMVPATSLPATTTTTQTATTTETTTTTTTAPTTTTTEPATTTTTIPTIGDGVWIVGDEIQPGTYRFTQYMARLDDTQDIIDNGLVSSGNGLGLMIVAETDSFIEISGEAVLVDHFPTADPIALGFVEGTYLVGVDLAPGDYRITPVGSSAYWARLDDSMDIIDNGLSEGQLIVTVQEGDWALSYDGNIEPVG